MLINQQLNVNKSTVAYHCNRVEVKDRTHILNKIKLNGQKAAAASRSIIRSLKYNFVRVMDNKKEVYSSRIILTY